MNFIPKLIFGILVVATSTIAFAKSSSDQKDLIHIVQKLYTEDAKVLLCRDPNGDLNEKLIAFLRSYFSNDFMKYYIERCFTRNLIPNWDIRTNQSNLFSFSDSKADFTNLKIEQPIVSENAARVRARYDLPDFPYKDNGYFAMYSFVKEDGQWKIDDIELGGKEFGEEGYDGYGVPFIESMKELIKERLIKKGRKNK